METHEKIYPDGRHEFKVVGAVTEVEIDTANMVSFFCPLYGHEADEAREQIKRMTEGKRIIPIQMK